MLAKRPVSSVNARFIKNTGRRWRVVIPTGVGLSLLAATQWNYLHKYGYPVEIEDRPELLNDVMVMDSRLCVITLSRCKVNEI